MNVVLRVSTQKVAAYGRLYLPKSYNRSFSVCLSQKNEFIANKSNRHQETIGLRQQHNMSTFASIYTELSNSSAVHFFQQNLIHLHDYSGLPWWSTIVLSTVLLRTITTFPLAVYTAKISARIEMIATEMPAIAKAAAMEVEIAKRQFNWSEKYAKRAYEVTMKQQWQKLVERENCHPAKRGIVIWGQIPLWICQSVAIRNLLQMLPDPTSVNAQIVLLQLSVGGFGWIPNLTEVDASYILPVFMCLVNLANIELHSLLRPEPASKMRTYVKSVFQLIAFALIPVSAWAPSCLALYWTTSCTYSFVQNLVLLSPRVKQVLRIPKNTKDHSEHPYQLLTDRLVERIRIRKASITSLMSSKKSNPE